MSGVYVCDLCAGSPKCVEVCTEGALIYTPKEKNKTTLEELKKETKKLNTIEKRANYIIKQGQELRKKWRN